MDLTDKLKKVPVFLKKYKYATLIIVIGLVLLSIPEFRTSKTESNPEQNVTIARTNDLEQRLAAILCLHIMASIHFIFNTDI